MKPNIFILFMILIKLSICVSFYYCSLLFGINPTNSQPFVYKENKYRSVVTGVFVIFVWFLVQYILTGTTNGNFG